MIPSAVQALQEEVKRLLAQVDELQVKCERQEGLLDGLSAALRGMVAIGPRPSPEAWNEAVDRAHATLTKTEGR